jgi:tripeptidyl-peptidase-1
MHSRCHGSFSRPVLSLSLFYLVLVQVLHGRGYVHEQRDSLPADWIQTPRTAALDDVVLHMRIALAQRNLDRANDFVLDVADPTSARFSQYWDPQQVAATFDPLPAAVAAVRQWLIQSGIRSEDIRSPNSSGFLLFNASVSQVELLLQTEYFVYEHTISQSRYFGCDQYHVPESIRDYVDLVTPAVSLTARLERPQRRPTSKRAVKRKTIGHLDKSVWPAPDDLSSCYKAITLNCVRALYGLPIGTTGNARNSFGVFEEAPGRYDEADLNVFFDRYAPGLVGRPPRLISIDGGPGSGFGSNEESDLDLEYAMALTYPLNVSLYSVGDMVEGGDENNFLDALDAFYCTYEGGNSPSWDPVFPDPRPGGYNHSEACGTVSPPHVLSFSYGAPEQLTSPAYNERQCSEYMKLALMGVTILFASGDEGVAGPVNVCNEPSPNTTVFVPYFPASCPYVTAVGSTMINGNSSVFSPETAVSGRFRSGGGFSNTFPLPSYQQQAVHNWFTQHPTGYAPDVFNQSMNSRAYPDVSANGNGYVFGYQGNLTLGYGTSISVCLSDVVFLHPFSILFNHYIPLWLASDPSSSLLWASLRADMYLLVDSGFRIRNHAYQRSSSQCGEEPRRIHQSRNLCPSRGLSRHHHR